MPPPACSKSPAAAQHEALSIWRQVFPESSRLFVVEAFGWALDCFSGAWPGYQAIDAPYHDLDHTLQVTLCLLRILQGREHSGAAPPMSENVLRLALAAALFHDAGYLKRSDDLTGTGAKYTFTHVTRSMDFAAAFLAGKSFEPGEIGAIRRMIQCTDMDTDARAVSFQDPLEQAGGFALATADLLAQMAAEDYIEKLPLLYAEYAEAEASNPADWRPVRFASARDLMQKTPQFWRSFAWPRIQCDLGAMDRFLRQPYPDGPNLYLERIEANLDKLSDLARAD